MAWGAKPAQNPSLPIELDDPVVAAVCHPDVLIRRDEQAVWLPDTLPLVQELAVGIEYLNPLVFAIADENATLIVHDNTVRQVELTRLTTEASPCLDEVPVSIELDDARVAVAVCDIDFAGPAERDVRWLVQEPICLGAPILAPENKENATRWTQLKDDMIAIVSRPDVVFGVDAQAVWVIEQRLADAPEEFPMLIELGQHRMRALKQEDVAFRIQCHSRRFPVLDRRWVGEGIGYESVTQFRHWEKSDRPRGLRRCSNGQEQNDRQQAHLRNRKPYQASGNSIARLESAVDSSVSCLDRRGEMNWRYSANQLNTVAGSSGPTCPPWGGYQN
ncbi:MAG: hypothetical protein ABI634_19330 [Acidobacteriota bacterium]